MGENGPSKPAHLPVLDGLRGLLALYVVGHHFIGSYVSSDLNPWLKKFTDLFLFGYMAVGPFIVLSGFSLMFPVARSNDQSIRGGFKGFFVRRAKRILPAYYATLVISILAIIIAETVSKPGTTVMVIGSWREELSITSIVSHLFLVHTWIKGQTYTINAALWSVATEWQIYFLFPTLLLPIWRRWGPVCLIIVAFGVGVLPLVIAPPDFELLHASPWYLGLFATGMLGAVLLESGSSLTIPRRALLALFLPLPIYLVIRWLPQHVEGSGFYSLRWFKDGLFGCAVCGFIVCCVFATRHSTQILRPFRLIADILERPTLKWLGSISYSLYATHWAILILIYTATTLLELSSAPALMVRTFVGVPVAVAFGWLVSIYFEAPYLKRRDAGVSGAANSSSTSSQAATKKVLQRVGQSASDSGSAG